MVRGLWRKHEHSVERMDIFKLVLLTILHVGKVRHASTDVWGGFKDLGVFFASYKCEHCLSVCLSPLLSHVAWDSAITSEKELVRGMFSSLSLNSILLIHRLFKISHLNLLNLPVLPQNLYFRKLMILQCKLWDLLFSLVHRNGSCLGQKRWKTEHHHQATT